jgi:hypothetical protein
MKNRCASHGPRVGVPSHRLGSQRGRPRATNWRRPSRFSPERGCKSRAGGTFRSQALYGIGLVAWGGYGHWIVWADTDPVSFQCSHPRSRPAGRAASESLPGPQAGYSTRIGILSDPSRTWIHEAPSPRGRSPSAPVQRPGFLGFPP